MRSCLACAVAILFCLCWLIGCNREAVPKATTEEKGESYSSDERAVAAKLKPVKDPISEEIYKYQVDTRQAYNNRRFDELERIAEETRDTKEVFGNGSWKIAQFYQSLKCREDEPENMWELHDQIHRAWMTAKPESITARVAYADFLVDYGWHARGHEYADKVTPEGWKLFGERLGAARKVFGEAQALPAKDPYLYIVGLSIALGQNWPESGYNALLGEAHASEPGYWGYDTTRAISLMPRWYGQPGEWEAYAEETSARPDGLGPELYARIVASQAGYYENVFRETQASWPKTREGLEQMRQKYPNSLVILNTTAKLATLADDRPLAREIFDRLGDTYLPEVWGAPERFAHYRKLAELDKAESQGK